VGDTLQSILAYDVGESGWTDDLTSFHEDIAGDSHYIDRASRAHALEALRRFLPRQPSVVMDIGCSSGYMLETMKANLPGATIIGADYVRGPLEQLAQRMPDVPLLQFDLTRCPLPSGCLDAVVLLNVLEHIEDDLAAIRQVARILKPGGIAVIELPAGPDLYDIYDKRLLHFRRYRMDDLVAKLQSQSFRVLDRSHLGFFLYPAFWIAKKRGQRLLKSDAQTQQKIVAKQIQAGKSNAVLHWVMGVEAALRKRIYYPFGIRCLVTCSKTGS
jgi:ubiquinone/menaquinone biosynthesis C-methylase UbiE